jgi:hypothetical protein
LREWIADHRLVADLRQYQAAATLYGDDSANQK